MHGLESVVASYKKFHAAKACLQHAISFHLRPLTLSPESATTTLLNIRAFLMQHADLADTLHNMLFRCVGFLEMNLGVILVQLTNAFMSHSVVLGWVNQQTPDEEKKTVEYEDRILVAYDNYLEMGGNVDDAKILNVLATPYVIMLLESPARAATSLVRINKLSDQRNGLAAWFYHHELLEKNTRILFRHLMNLCALLHEQPNKLSPDSKQNIILHSPRPDYSAKSPNKASILLQEVPHFSLDIPNSDPLAMSEEKVVEPIKESVKPIVRDTSALASIQLVHSRTPVEGFSKLVRATVKGYNVMVDDDTFFPEGVTESRCIYLEVDSLLDPENPAFSDFDSKHGRLIKTKGFKIKGGSAKVYSQGLCLPLTALEYYKIKPQDVKMGQDVTAAMKVTKYVSNSEKSQYVAPANGTAPFPVQVPKTDELNAQTYPEMLEQMRGRRVAVTQKVDGSSMTYTSDGQICGRNYEWTAKTPSNAAYFAMVDKYKLDKVVKGSGYNVQGELVGPKIQKNPLQLKECKWLVYNIYHKGQYLPHAEVVKKCQEWGLDMVPCLFGSPDVAFDDLPFKTVEDWVSLADKQEYAHPDKPKPAEGLVIKTVDGKEPRISCKVMSRVYLTQ